MSTTPMDQYAELDLAEFYEALLKLRDGDFSVRLTEAPKEPAGMVARMFNSMVERLEMLAKEVIRVTDETGKRSYLGAQAEVPGASGRWNEMVTSLNNMSEILTEEVRRTSQTAQAWAEGDTSKRLGRWRVLGEFAEMQERLDAAVMRWTSSPAE